MKLEARSGALGEGLVVPGQAALGQDWAGQDGLGQDGSGQGRPRGGPGGDGSAGGEPGRDVPAPDRHPSRPVAPSAIQPLEAADLDHVLARTLELSGGVWEELRGERVLLTGGTGFFGMWLTESFLHINRRLGLGARLVVLSRRPAAWLGRAPHLAASDALRVVEGDVRSFAFPTGRFACVVHAATESVVPAGTSEEAQYSAIVEGTRRVLAFAAEAGAGRFLLASSGAVYGSVSGLTAADQPLLVQADRPLLVREDQPFAPSASVYARGKREAEALCVTSGVPCTIARGFAFVGPHLPLDAHFAVGNFLRDALAGRAIEVKGDGTPLRSYLYAADLAVWLWTILLKGAARRAYNVGSEEAVSIGELAGRVAAGVAPLVGERVGVRVAMRASEGAGAPARYVPSTQRARAELGLEAWIGLDEAIRRTAAWHRETGSQVSPGGGLGAH